MTSTTEPPVGGPSGSRPPKADTLPLDEAAWPPLDEAVLTNHVALIHQLAAASGAEGWVVLFSAGQNPRTERDIKEQSRHFGIGDVDGMVKQAKAWRRHPYRNVYAPYAVFGKLEPGKKGAERDLIRVLALVADQDNDKGVAGALPLPAPYMVESSSGNFQSVYPLSRALTLAEGKPIGQALANALGGDSGPGDMSHVWRVPGLLNWPTQSKLKRGRSPMPQLVTVAKPWTGGLIDPETLRAAIAAMPRASRHKDKKGNGRDHGAKPRTNGSAGPGAPGVDPDFDGDTTRIFGGNLDVLKECLAHILPEPRTDYNPWLKVGMGVHHETDGSDEGLELWREWSRQMPNFNEAEFEKKWRSFKTHGPRKVTGKSLAKLAYQESGWINPLAETWRASRIAEINHEYAWVEVSAKYAILRENGRKHKLLLPETFKSRLKNKPTVPVGEDKSIPIADYWLAHPDRRQYDDIEFAPEGTPPNIFNLWKGFAVEPKEGDCSRFLAHLHENVAQGDEGLYCWVIGWFAQLFQQPGKKTGTSLVLRGKQGVGKTKVGEVFESLLGPHYLLVSQPRHVTGHFNAHMASLLLLHADEAFWAGSREAEGRLKDLITGNRHLLEHKGLDPIPVANHMRLLVSGNDGWQVPAAFEERRFAVLDVGKNHIVDFPYFAAIDEQMKQGGREALLWHLLHFDLSSINLRAIPKTQALLEQKIASMGSKEAWWFEVLQKGELPRIVFDPEGIKRSLELEDNQCLKEALFEDYIRHSQHRGERHRSLVTEVGIFLDKHVPRLATDRASHGRERPWVYRFPPLRACREAYGKAMQHTIDWGKGWEAEGWGCATDGEGLPF
jgi:Primase C terminal 2 (PriCT-2)/Family of unknown function (DUF5906)/RepB DNA-primase from phage plasmid